MDEIWKDIEGYEGLYKVSNTGKVYSCKRYCDLSSNRKNNRGYRRITLSKDKEQKEFFVHRLVASAFVTNPNPELFTVVDHLDGNKLNNNATNLEWVTPEENRRRALIMYGYIEK